MLMEMNRFFHLELLELLLPHLLANQKGPQLLPKLHLLLLNRNR